MVRVEEALPKEYLEAYDKSFRKYRNATLKKAHHINDCDIDGKPCPFLRMYPSRYIIAYVCTFDRCVKRYPTKEDLLLEEKIQGEITEK
jgi:hypothetical protein